MKGFVVAFALLVLPAVYQYPVSSFGLPRGSSRTILFQFEDATTTKEPPSAASVAAASVATAAASASAASASATAVGASAINGTTDEERTSDGQEGTDLEAIVIGKGGVSVAGAVRENGTATAAAGGSDESEVGEFFAEGSGPGVASVAAGNATTLTFVKNNTMSAYSGGTGNEDKSIGVASDGEGTVVVRRKNDTNVFTNRARLRKNNRVTASSTGAMTSTSISDEDGSAVGTSSTGQGTASASASSSPGVGSAGGHVSTGAKRKGGKGGGGIATSGSASSGSAVTSISSSDDGSDDSAEVTASVSAISTRLSKKNRRANWGGDKDASDQTILL